jgi:[ribosomal protein S5]-alanine N-acetyltransferase
MDIILQTSRLLLRRFTDSEADASLIYQLNKDPEVLKFLQEPVLKNKAQAHEILQKIILPQYKKNLGRWAIHLLAGNEFIGWCGLKHRPEKRETDLGYRLKKSAWGHGYATEAATACLSYGFSTLPLKKIVARAHVENQASIAILQKIGMKYTGENIVDDCLVKTFVARRKEWKPQ